MQVYYTGLCENSQFSMWFPPQPFISMKREWQVRRVYRPPLPLAHPSGFGLVWFWFEEEGQSSGSGSVCGLVWRWEGIEQEEVYTCNFLIQSLGSVLLCLQPLAWGLHREHQCLTVAQWSSGKYVQMQRTKSFQQHLKCTGSSTAVVFSHVHFTMGLDLVIDPFQMF